MSDDEQVSEPERVPEPDLAGQPDGDAGPPARPNRQAVAFRLWTLLLGLALFVGLAWLIMRA